jgi:iron complex outermembrane receptor protein
MSLNRKVLAAVIGAVSILPAGAAFAQDTKPQDSGSLLEEIVVTAQRRAEKVQDVPIAISAFSAEQLERLNVSEALGISKLIPNLLAFNNTGLGTANGYYLRGIGNTESIPTFDPPVGTYVDDVFISRQNANNLALFDAERIEVLRGPQGTLFGRNTTGGAVNVILRKPAEEFGGYIEAGFGQFGMQTVRGTVDLPVSDRVLTKFTGYMAKDDGFVSNPVTGENDINAQDSYGLRAALRFNVSDAVTWDLAAQYTRDEGLNILNWASGKGSAYLNGVTGGPLTTIPAGGPQVTLIPLRAGLVPTSAAAQSVEARCSPAPFAITRSRFTCTGLAQTGTPLANLTVGRKKNLNLGNEVKNTMITSNVEWETGLGTVDFITGYVEMKQQFAIDFFNGTARHTATVASQASNPAGGFTIANDGKNEQISQEVKLTGSLNDSTRYVAGVYYFDEKNDTDFVDLFGLSPTFSLVLEDRILKNKATAWAAYTQWDFTFAEKFTLTAGGRYTDETKKVDFTPNANPLMAAPTAATRVSSANMVANGIPLKLNTKLFTPRLAVKYDVNEDMNFFASATRGFKSGGWNARGTAPVANQAFDPETVWSYEVGMRSEWLDRKLRFNVTAFQLDVKDLQTPSAFVAPSGAISFITRNFAGMENTGFEVEVVAKPVADLSLFAFIGRQNAKYKDLAPSIVTQQQECLAGIAGTAGGNLARCSQGIVDPSGRIAEPVRVPDTATLGASYTFHIGDNLTLTPNVLWAYTGDNNVGTNGAPVSLVSSYEQIDAGLTLQSVTGGWQVQANCRNCTDSEQIVSTLSELPYLQDPRTWSVMFKYNFGGRR